MPHGDEEKSRPDWTRPRAVPEPEAVFRLRVNGQQREVTCRRDTPLLYVLRNDLGLVGSRFGCGTGQCGACMVIVEGKAVPSCDTPLWSVEKKSVTTVEGLAKGDRAPSGAEGAPCRAGGAVRLLHVGHPRLRLRLAPSREGASPNRADIAEALHRNLCRCGSHGRVLGAVEDAAPTV